MTHVTLCAEGIELYEVALIHLKKVATHSMQGEMRQSRGPGEGPPKRITGFMTAHCHNELHARGEIQECCGQLQSTVTFHCQEAHLGTLAAFAASIIRPMQSKLKQAIFRRGDDDPIIVFTEDMASKDIVKEIERAAPP